MTHEEYEEAMDKAVWDAMRSIAEESIKDGFPSTYGYRNQKDRMVVYIHPAPKRKDQSSESSDKR